jgi:hypothetical protein
VVRPKTELLMLGPDLIAKLEVKGVSTTRNRFRQSSSVWLLAVCIPPANPNNNEPAKTRERADENFMSI